MKKLVQFNNFSFFSFGADVKTSGGENSFKVETENLDYAHGSFFSHCGELLANERTYEVSFLVKNSNVPHSYRNRLLAKFRREVSFPGTLWAYENDNLFYTEAVVESYLEEPITDGVRISVNFIAPSPFWVMADNNRTLINTFDNICAALSCEAEANRVLCQKGCLNFKIFVQDISCGCCRECPDGRVLCDFERGAVDKLFEECFNFPVIAYDCNACGDYSGIKLGRKHGQDNITTTLDVITQAATPVNWAMIGHFKDIIFRINENIIRIEGEYKGVLEYRNGRILYNGERQKLSVISSELPSRRTHKLNPGKNGLQISNLRDWRFSIILDWENLTY